MSGKWVTTVQLVDLRQQAMGSYLHKQAWEYTYVNLIYHPFVDDNEKNPSI